MAWAPEGGEPYNGESYEPITTVDDRGRVFEAIVLQRRWWEPWRERFYWAWREVRGATPTGYGSGWREPLAVGRAARFRQWLREPGTKTVWLYAYFFGAMAFLIGLFAASVAFKGE